MRDLAADQPSGTVGTPAAGLPRRAALMREGGVPERCAVALLRTVFPYGIGFALAELSLPAPPPPGPEGEIALIRHVTGLLPAQAPDDLLRTALLVSGDCDMTSQFHVGVDLMIRRLDAYLQTMEEDAATAPA